ncbi:ABC transporter permease subunit [Synechococcales cyanobacterium C]|uniref:ABC transporter permease subunit n=2 Tax=Petrachloros TaxID=2918834 RepID=A0A8K1ZX59_9CYAN|nr:iron ABC transporter permease [Petrachloros mirabilis]NCJ06900.1 ABC transporter permease subunit [Petrachloros mirabilis ULC683]
MVLLAAVPATGILLLLFYLGMRAAGAGLPEFWAIISQPRTLEVLLNSIGMTVAITLLSALIAIPLAFLTVRTDLPWRRFWLVVTTLPLAIPTYVGSFALIAAVGPRGSILQMLLQPLGVERLPSIYGWPGVILAIGLFTYPYLLLSVRAGLQGMDPSMEESARVLGYGSRATFLKVTLPQLRPSIAAGSLLVALYALQDFGTPGLMRFNSFTRAIFIQYRASFNRNTAAALALVLVVLVLGILFLEYWARSRAVYYSRGSAVPREQTLIPLGRWKWPAVVFCALIASISFAMPIGVIAFWLIRGLIYGGASDRLLSTLLPIIWNSVYAAGLAALIAIIFALPVAILSVRFPSRLSTLLERCSYLGFGMPGIVVALTLVFFGANFAPWLYQKLPMMLFAYLVLFLPQAIGTIRSSLLQVNPSLEESARVLGRSPWQTLQEVTLPLVRPGIISGGMLIFLTAMKELPATLLLAPIGFRTLATQIWQATAEDAAFANAAAAALAILAVSTLSTLIILSQERILPRPNLSSSRNDSTSIIDS